jgi:lipopolysaccharide/colanic/teichoic acid biosynthesis glycosyltransferase
MTSTCCKPVQRFIKRCADVIAAACALILSSVFILPTALWIRLSMGSPVLFRQTRPGRGGKPFSICKFRTMRDALDAGGNPLPDEDRMTAVGSFVRKYSLDEFPQFLNVLTGTMSIVGPRPLLMQYLPLYNERQATRHDVTPGITGWAQVNGRNAISWEQKFKYDAWYVENWSLWLDAKIFLLTVLKVVRRSDISQKGAATMPAFTGSENPPA